MGKYTAIGGQALIEGILMKSPEKTAMAVRVPDGSIDVSLMDQKSIREKYKIFALPIIRGVVAFVESMLQGYKAMMISADKSGFTDLEEEEEKAKKAAKAAKKAEKSGDEEPLTSDSETDKAPNEEKKENKTLLTVIMVIAAVLGVALSVALFMYVPRKIVDGISWLFKVEITNPIIRSSIEQLIKLAVFVGYVWAVSFMKDIKRVFMYHGAEHKTIFCYEKGLELTVENVRGQRRFHPRCGTSFMILMILISIVISTVVQMIFPRVYDIPAVWVAAKLLMIPFICGVGFEVLRFCGKYDNIITRIISAPGLWLQRITTKEPDDGMIEIAIAALKACEPENPDVQRPVCACACVEEKDEQNDI